MPINELLDLMAITDKLVEKYFYYSYWNGYTFLGKAKWYRVYDFKISYEKVLES